MSKKEIKVEMKLVKMDDVKFNDDLFIPIKSKTIVDSLLSTEGGVFPGTNTVVIGDPGVGKSTVLLDLLAQYNKDGKKVLFISGEMNEIDMYGYVKRYPSFGQLPIMFMNDYTDCPKEAVEQVLDQGYDVVLIDSWAEVTALVADQQNWARKKVESWLLDLLEKNNKAKKFHELKYDDAISKNLKIMDSTAFTLSKENKLPIIVFDINKTGNLKKIIQGKIIGTKVN